MLSPDITKVQFTAHFVMLRFFSTAIWHLCIVNFIGVGILYLENLLAICTLNL